MKEDENYEDIDGALDEILNGKAEEERTPITELRQNVARNDALLLELAMYKATKGQTTMLSDMQIVQDVFTELKGRVMRSGVPIEQLERDILVKYGVASVCPKQVDPSGAIKAMLGGDIAISGREEDTNNMGF